MSIQSINIQIANIDREINTLEINIQSIDSNISRKQKEANDILAKISNEKDLKRIITYQKDYNKKNDEVRNLEKTKTPKSKLLAEKQKKKNELQFNLYKEEQKEREQTKKEQKEILSLQQKITREMQYQKNLSLHSIDIFKPHENNSNNGQDSNYDVFISHASEDKDDFVRPFAVYLRENGVSVWYDEFELQIGDSLRRNIDKGLKYSRYGIVVLSEAFFNKDWPQRELDGLFAREINGEKVILPIWHKISKMKLLSIVRL